MDRIPACRQAGKFPEPTVEILRVMIFVYAIKSELNGVIYVGMTCDVEKRLKEHNSGKTKSTKAYRPWKVIYTQENVDWQKGRIREKYFKSGVGKEFLKKLVP